jgi:hypothetical protein
MLSNIVVTEFSSFRGRFITHTPRVLTPNLEVLIPDCKTRVGAGFSGRSEPAYEPHGGGAGA